MRRGTIDARAGDAGQFVFLIGDIGLQLDYINGVPEIAPRMGLVKSERAKRHDLILWASQQTQQHLQYQRSYEG